ncbi:MAG: hypothetical protein M1820_010118 [Bogoriella megaspora]|nr:MAG: hypothetical protein M1820_010118 [Bogoriella megaspora]
MDLKGRINAFLKEKSGSIAQAPASAVQTIIRGNGNNINGNVHNSNTASTSVTNPFTPTTKRKPDHTTEPIKRPRVDNDATAPLQHANTGSDQSFLDQENSGEDAESPQDVENAMSEFKQRYHSMDDSKKWKLGRGRCMEDIIFQHINKKSMEVTSSAYEERRYLPYSFTVDVTDEELRAQLNEGEKVAFDAETNACSKKDLENLVRNRIVAGKLYGVQGYITQALFKYQHMCENPALFSSESNSEIWMIVNVHSKLLDEALQATAGFVMQRGEARAVASAERRCNYQDLSIKRREGAK